MNNHEFSITPYGNSRVTQGEELLLDDLERGVDPEVLDDVGYNIQGDHAPDAKLRYTAGTRELNELHPQYPKSEDRFRGAGKEVTPEEAAEMSEEHGSKCGDCGAEGGTCQHWRPNASGRLGTYGE